MQEYIAFWTNYFNFSDRTTVRGYWMYALVNLIVAIAMSIFSIFLDFVNILITIYSIASIIPSFSMSVRRLHDINKSGWWLLIVLIPLIGPIILLVWSCFGSVDQGNRYGTYKV